MRKILDKRKKNKHRTIAWLLLFSLLMHLVGSSTSYMFSGANDKFKEYYSRDNAIGPTFSSGYDDADRYRGLNLGTDGWYALLNKETFMFKDSDATDCGGWTYANHAPVDFLLYPEQTSRNSFNYSFGAKPRTLVLVSYRGMSPTKYSINNASFNLNPDCVDIDTCEPFGVFEYPANQDQVGFLFQVQTPGGGADANSAFALCKLHLFSSELQNSIITASYAGRKSRKSSHWYLDDGTSEGDPTKLMDGQVVVVDITEFEMTDDTERNPSMLRQSCWLEDENRSMYGDSVDGRPTLFVMQVDSTSVVTIRDIIFHNYYSSSHVEDNDGHDYSNKYMKLYVVPRGDVFADKDAYEVSDLLQGYIDNDSSVQELEDYIGKSDSQTNAVYIGQTKKGQILTCTSGCSNPASIIIESKEQKFNSCGIQVIGDGLTCPTSATKATICTADNGLAAAAWVDTLTDLGTIMSQEQSGISGPTFTQVPTTFSGQCDPSAGEEDCHYQMIYYANCNTYDPDTTTHGSSASGQSWDIVETQSTYPITYQVSSTATHDMDPGEYICIAWTWFNGAATYSNWITMTIDGSDQCPSATMTAPVSAVATFSTSLSVNAPDGPGTAGEWHESDVAFDEWPNSVCPDLCFGGSSCSPVVYTVWCKHKDLFQNNEVPYYDASVGADGGVHWLNAKVDDASATLDPTGTKKSVWIQGVDAHIAEKQITCKVKGVLETTQEAESQTFTVDFSPCGVASFCQNVTLSTLPDPLAAEEEPGRFYIDSGATNSTVFPAFSDSITTECSATDNCHDTFVYKYSKLACSTCNNEALCNTGCDAWVEMNDGTFTEALNSDGDAYEVTFQVTAATGSYGKYKMKIKARQEDQSDIEANYVYSDEFQFWVDGQPDCASANLLATTATNIPSFTNDLLEYGVVDVSDVEFDQFYNDICPAYCWKPDRLCTDETYTVDCQEDGTVDYHEATTWGMTSAVATESNTYHLTDGNEYKKYTADIENNEPSLFFRTFNCHMTASMNTQTQSTGDFIVVFDHCGQPDVCPLVTHMDIPAGDEPGGANTSGQTTDTDGVVGLYASHGEVSASTQNWPYFEDIITAGCGVADDCHDVLRYQMQLIDCDTCSTDCDTPTSCTITEIGDETNFVDVPLEEKMQFTYGPFDDTFLRKKYRMRIRAHSTVQTNGPNYVYSEWFKFLVNGVSACDQANLITPDASNKPAFANDVAISSTAELSTTDFTEFENDICPDFCYMSDDHCNSIDYSVLCRDSDTAVTGDPNVDYIDPVADAGTGYQGLLFDAVNANNAGTAVSENARTLQVSIQGTDAALIGEQYYCVIKGTHADSSSEAFTEEFPVAFTPCREPENSCALANEWEADVFTKVPSFSPPADATIAVYDPPFSIVFNHAQWTDWFSEVCADISICGERVFEWFYLDDTVVDENDSLFIFEQHPIPNVSSTLVVSTLNRDTIGNTYEFKLVGTQTLENPSDAANPYDQRTVEYDTITVTVADPCYLDDQVYVVTQDIQDDTINLGTGEATVWTEPYWDNQVNMDHYDDVSDTEAFPLCGFPEYYQLVEAKDDDTAGDPLTNIDCQFTLDQSQGGYTFECQSDLRSLNDTYQRTYVQTWTVDETGAECCHSVSNPFQIYFWAEPDAEVIAPPQVEADNSEVTIDNSDITKTEIIVTFTATDVSLAAAQTEVDMATANFISVENLVSSNQVVQRKLVIRVTPEVYTGDYIVKVKGKDIQDSEAEIEITITVVGQDPVTEDLVDELITNEFEFNAPKVVNSAGEDPLTAEIQSISNTGLMTIVWNRPVLPMRNVTTATIDELQLFLIQLGNEEDQTADFSFTPLRMNPTELFIQLEFSKPLQISAGNIFDDIKVYMLSEVFMLEDVWGFHENWVEEVEATNVTVAEEDRRLSNKRRLYDPLYNQEKLEEKVAQEMEIRRVGRTLQADYHDTDLFTLLQSPIPPQIELEQAAIVEKQAEQAGDFLSGLFWLPFIVQIVMSSAMAHVWNILNTIQIVNTFPLFSVNVPENVKSVLVSFNKIANLQVVPKAEVYAFLNTLLEPEPIPGYEEEFYAAKEEKEQAELEAKIALLRAEVEATGGTVDVDDEGNIIVTEGDQDEADGAPVLSKKDQNFADFGMDTTKVLQGAMQLLVGAVAVATALFLIFFCKEYICFNAPQWVNKIFRAADQKLRYNSVLRAMIESYYGICMTSCLTVRDKWNWDTTENMVNSLSTLAFLPYIIGFPIWIVWFLKRNRFALSSEDFRKRYNSLYLNVDYFNKEGTIFTAVLLTRKFTMVATAIFFGASPILQVAVALYASQLVAQFFVKVRPMVDGINNFIQIFNEWCILCWCIQMLSFTDYVPWPEMRFEIGWYFLYQIYFNVGLNGCLIVFLIIKQIIQNLRRRNMVKQARERQRNVIKRNQFVAKRMKGKSQKELRKIFKQNAREEGFSISDDSMDNSNNQIDIDQIGTKPHVEKVVNRTFLQKRQDQKQAFIEKMARWKQEDALKGDVPGQQTQKYQDKIKASADPFAKPEQVEEWEEEMWRDVYRDESGNLIRMKEQKEGEAGLGAIQEDVSGEQDWEIVSSQSMKQRRVLQAQTDWPLSARAQEEKERIAQKNAHKNNIKGKILDQHRDDVSNEWSWDHEKESDISEWLGMPKEEFKKSFSVGDSGLMDDDEMAEINKAVEKAGDSSALPKLGGHGRNGEVWQEELSEDDEEDESKDDESEGDDESEEDRQSSTQHEQSRKSQNDDVDASRSQLDISVEDSAQEFVGHNRLLQRRSIKRAEINHRSMNSATKFFSDDTTTK